jgi:hypothetical protein
MSAIVSSPLVHQLLAAYQHVADCAWCREYAEDYLDDHPRMQVLAAVLDHHDSAHMNDRLGRSAPLF